MKGDIAMNYREVSENNTFGFEEESKHYFDYSREPENPIIEYEPVEGVDVFKEHEFQYLLQRIAKSEGEDVAISIRRYKKAYELCKYFMLFHGVDDLTLDRISVERLRLRIRGLW